MIEDAYIKNCYSGTYWDINANFLNPHERSDTEEK